MLILLPHADSIRIVDLFLDVFSQEPWCDRWQSRELAVAYLNDCMGNQQSLSFGCMQGEDLVGLCLGSVFHWWEGMEYHVKEFCIARQFQGKGIGGQFLQDIEAALAQRDIHAILLSTGRDVPAYTFYHHHGFRELTGSVELVKIF